MDCFYVQVEQRLNPALKNTPCVVAQYKTWKGGGWVPDAEMHIKWWWKMMKHWFPAQPRSLKLIVHCTHDCTPFTSAKKKKKQRQTLSICRSGSSHFTSEQPLNGYYNQRHAVFCLSYLFILIHQLSGFQVLRQVWDLWIPDFWLVDCSVRLEGIRHWSSCVDHLSCCLCVGNSSAPFWTICIKIYTSVWMLCKHN